MTASNRFARIAILIAILAVFAAGLAAASTVVAVGSISGGIFPNSDGAEAYGAIAPAAASQTADSAVVERRLFDEPFEEDSDVGIRNAGYEGMAVVRIVGGVTYLFEDEPHRLEVTVETGSWSGNAEVCVWIPRDGGGDPRAVTCEPIGSLDSHDMVSETVDFESWMGNEISATTVRVAVVGNPEGERQSLDETELEVRALSKDEDISASGLTTEQELAYGTDFLRADTAGNGLTDGQELRETGTDPLVRDTAGNGVPDGMEVILGTDPSNPWTPHIYLVLLAVFFGIGLVILDAVVSRVRRLGYPPESDRPKRAERRRSSGNASLLKLLDRRPVDLVEGGWPISRPSDADRFVTDEQRVVRLLEQKGGRMPQSELVAETDWSKSKVSRLLSGMEDNGTIAKIPIGRTNLVVLGGHEEFAGNAVGEEI